MEPNNGFEETGIDNGGHRQDQQQPIPPESGESGSGPGGTSGDRHDTGAGSDSGTPRRIDATLGDVQTPLVPQLISQSIVPFLGISPINSVAEQTRDSVREKIADCDTLLTQTESQIRQYVVECVSECDNGYNECVSCILGKIGFANSDSDNTIGRCFDKIIGRVGDIINDVYATSYEVGIAAPTELEVSQFLPENQPAQILAQPGLPGCTFDRKEDIPFYVPEECKFQCLDGKWSYTGTRLADGTWSCTGLPRIPPQQPPVVRPPKPGPQPIPPRPMPPLPPQNGQCPPPEIHVHCPSECDDDETPPEEAPPEETPPDEPGTEPVCPVPPAYEQACSTETREDAVATMEIMPDWSKFTVCRDIDEFMRGPQSDWLATRKNLSFYREGGMLVVPGWYSGIHNMLPWYLRDRVHAAIDGLLNLWVDIYFTKIFQSTCLAPVAIGWMVTYSLFNLASYLIGRTAEKVMTPLWYSISYNCPQQIPSQADADNMFLSDVASFDEWTCLTRANNNVDTWHNWAMIAKRTKPSPLDLIVAKRRRIITDAEFQKRIRNTGVIDGREQDIFYRITEWIPGPTDLVRFMVRDIGDTRVVEDEKLDGVGPTAFDRKYHGELEKWGEGQGVTREAMRAYWRAHWVYPSNTQLYTMLHRLRPDSLDPEARQLAIDETLVERILAINDVAPNWIKRLAKISYTPPRLIDIKNAYLIGTINRAVAFDQLQNRGYEKHVAAIVINYWEQAYKTKRLRMDLGISARSVLGLFEREAIEAAEVDRLLSLLGFSPEEIQIGIDAGRIKMNAKRRLKTRDVIHRRRRVGDIDVGTASTLLQRIGYTGIAASEIVSTWQFEREVKGREIAAAELCKWRYFNIITQEQHYSRLREIGFKPEDAQRIAVSCELSNIEKGQKKKKPPAGDAGG